MFDRQTGEVWGRLFLRPELAAYETALARHIAEWSSIDDPRLVPVRTVQRDPDTGRVVVLSHHVSGVRLSDVLRLAREHEAVPELTVAIFLAGELLAGIHAFHTATGVPHGILSADRAIVSSTGDVMIADSTYAEVIETARFSRQRLWEQFGVAPWPGDPISLAGDVRQAAVVTIAMMLGRPLEVDDLPGRLDALLGEVEDAALIRGGRLFAEPVIAWLKRALAAGTAFGFATADEAAGACSGLLTDRERAAGPPGLLQFVEDVTAPPVAPALPVEDSSPEVEEEGEELEEAVRSEPSVAASLATPEPVEVPRPELVAVALSATAVPAARVAIPAPDLDPQTVDAPMPWAAPAPGFEHRRRDADATVSSRSPFAVLDAPAAPRAPSPPPAPVSLAPSPFQPAPSLVVPPAAPVAAEASAPAASAIRLKEPPRSQRSTIGIFEPPADASVSPAPEPEESVWSRFRLPWKLAAAAALVLATGLAGKVLWSGGDQPAAAAAVAVGVLVVETEPEGSELFVNGESRGLTPATLDVPPGRYDLKLQYKETTHTWAVDVAAGARKVERLNWAALKPVGGLEIVSNTEGARVLLNGKPAGETPLTLTDLAPGRYTVVVQAPTGAVRRVVTVVAGETATVDAAIYSGWVLVSAPIELQVLENGRAIAVAGEGPIMLSAGRHNLDLVNDALGYRATHEVDIKPGEEERLEVTPTGTVNVNALPWAEVWLDGSKLGETPLANVMLPLGTRDVVFRHPEYGERKLSITVKAGAPMQVSVDLSKP